MRAVGKLNKTAKPCVHHFLRKTKTFTGRNLYILETLNTTWSIYSVRGNKLHLTFVLLHVSREISITEGEETLKRELSGDLSKLLEGLWVSLPQNLTIFSPTGALISEPVKYSALLTHFSLADREEERWGHRGVESLISRESAGPNPWMNAAIITISSSHMLAELIVFPSQLVEMSRLKDRERDGSASVWPENKTFQSLNQTYVIFALSLLLNFLCKHWKRQ